MSVWDEYSNGNCFIIAEAGVSHFGSLQKAYQLVDMAVSAKADAVKFQIFNLEKLFAEDETEWKERLGPRALSVDEFRSVQNYCNESGIRFFATAHDEDSLDQLIEMGVDLLKVGSGEVGNYAYLEKIIKSGIPAIISTGMYTKAQISDLIDIIGNQFHNIALLHCVTEYPTPLIRVNLSRMLSLKKMYKGEVGYSDHTDSALASIVAVSIGARIIEKHISLDFNVPNAQDWKVSLDEEQLCAFVRNIREVETLREVYSHKLKFSGESNMELTAEQESNLKWASKSAVYKSNIAKGGVVNIGDLEFKRPGTGLNYKSVCDYLGEPVTKDVFIGNRVCRSDFQ